MWSYDRITVKNWKMCLTQLLCKEGIASKKTLGSLLGHLESQDNCYVAELYNKYAQLMKHLKYNQCIQYYLH